MSRVAARCGGAMSSAMICNRESSKELFIGPASASCMLVELGGLLRGDFQHIRSVSVDELAGRSSLVNLSVIEPDHTVAEMAQGIQIVAHHHDRLGGEIRACIRWRALAWKRSRPPRGPRRR